MATKGATTAEYAVLTGLISVVIVLAVAAYGLNALARFTNAKARIIDATP
ncbi:MAG: Flp family type IVb pilin [Dermatophilaceae bacterium]|nr:Flp family type IVb pilin [Dermatophilaceae bacterium]